MGNRPSYSQKIGVVIKTYWIPDGLRSQFWQEFGGLCAWTCGGDDLDNQVRVDGVAAVSLTTHVDVYLILWKERREYKLMRLLLTFLLPTLQPVHRLGHQNWRHWCQGASSGSAREQNRDLAIVSREENLSSDIWDRYMQYSTLFAQACSVLNVAMRQREGVDEGDAADCMYVFSSSQLTLCLSKVLLLLSFPHKRIDRNGVSDEGACALADALKGDRTVTYIK